MSVTFVGHSAVADSSGSPVTSINVDRTALTLAVGDYCLIWGWANTTVDWTMSPGADGVAWTKLWKYDRFQVWGKFLGSGFSTSVTAVAFSGGHVVFGIEQAFYRGAKSLSWRGSVSGSGRDSFQAPAAYPTGKGGRVGRLFTMGETVAGATMSRPGGVSDRGGAETSNPVPGFIWFLCDATYTGSGNVGLATTNINNGLTESQRRYLLANAVTIIFNENQPPNAPTLVSPPDGSSISTSATIRFSWTSSDPDGDPQSGFTLRYRDSTTSGPWVPNTNLHDAREYFETSSLAITIGDTVEWQVATYDSSGALGPYSASRFFVYADTPTLPTIDYPTDGGTVARQDRVDWTFTGQEDWEVRRVADDIDGNPDTGTIYEDDTSTDSTDATDTRTFPLTFATNGRYEHIEVRCKKSGLWSDWADVRVFVSYVAPPTADLQVLAGDDGASIALAWTVAAPDGSITDQPAATSVSQLVSTDGGTTWITYRTGLPISSADVADPADAVYPVPCSGLDYVFAVEAFADNGTASMTDWITRGRLTISEAV